MENFAVSVVLALLIIIPLAYKWELNLKVVSISALIIGLFVGLVISIIEKYFFMGLPLKLISCLVLIASISLSALLVRFYRDPDRVPPEGQNIILSVLSNTLNISKKVKFRCPQKEGKR